MMFVVFLFLLSVFWYNALMSVYENDVYQSSPTPTTPSRRSRRERESRTNPTNSRQTNSQKESFLSFDHLNLLIFSLVLSLTFYSFPLWSHQAVYMQSQNLYSGLAMNQGQVPYNNFWGTGGVLFYVINWAGTLGNSTLFLYLFELIALVMSGIFVRRLIVETTGNKLAARLTSLGAVIVIAGLSRGGDTPALFALPFVLWAVIFLNRYFTDQINKDEAFILYGLSAGIVFVISPIMILLWIVSFIPLIIHNIKNKKTAVGFYQFLGTILGILIIGYSVGYFSLNQQTSYISLEQSLFIPFTRFGISGEFFTNLVKTIVVLLVFNFATQFMIGMRLKKESQVRAWHISLLTGSVFSVFIILFSYGFDVTNFLVLLPLLIIFVGVGLRSAIVNKRNLLSHYLGQHLFMPMIALLVTVALPLYGHFIKNHQVIQDEQTIAQYVKNNTNSGDNVYVIGPDKNINLLSGRVTDIDNIPAHYPTKYKTGYDLNVSQIKDKYIIVDKSMAIPESTKTLLKSTYTNVKDLTTASFDIYKIK